VLDQATKSFCNLLPNPLSTLSLVAGYLPRFTQLVQERN